tara:strand:- start:7512 stop:8030 length:519 start_codon:yes stop_codon:yes gene_type:complete
MGTPRKIPINRINKFFSNEDFNLEIEMGREVIEGDGNFVVVLYRVDRELTASDDIYGEAQKDDIQYLPPVELRVIPILAPAENKTYNPSTLNYLEDGQLTFAIYDAQLAELDVELSVGDYIGYSVKETEMRFYSVSNDGRKNFDNAHTIMGYKSAYRTVVCAPVDENEFRAL